MNLRRIFGALVILTALLDCAVNAQAVADQPQRREGEIWFEPDKVKIGAHEGERGHLMVRENRQNPKSNLIELVFVRLRSTADKPAFPTVYLDGGPGSSAINLANVPDYMQAFQKLREVGDVILLDQRGVGRSRPSLLYLLQESLPADVFADREVALRAFRERAKVAADHFRSKGVDILAYNTIESAHDVDDLRKALGAEKLNLVGFSYGTHLGLACIRYHGKNLNRVVLIGTEGPDHTDKLPSTSDASIKRLSDIVAKDPEIGPKMPDLAGTLKRVLDRLEKEPVTVTITDQRTRKPVDVRVGKIGLQFLIMRDLGDTNDLPVFPLWFYTMDKGDYSVLKRFVERRYNQFGEAFSIMTLVMDVSSGVSKARQLQIQKEAKTALLGDLVNFPISQMGDVIGNPDLGDAYRSQIKTDVPTLFVSGVLDNNTQPFQADEVRRTFKNSTHIVIDNAGHESMLVDAQVQQTMVQFLRGEDVSKVKIALPPLKFQPLPAVDAQTPKPPANVNDLTATISALDKDFFDAYNKCDLSTIDSLFTDDVEFYHEKRGQLVSRASVMEVFSTNLCGDKNNRVRREIVDGSLRVYAIEGYGALAVGEHRFYLTMGAEKEKLDGIGQFANLWQLKDGRWKMSRVFSYGFRTP